MARRPRLQIDGAAYHVMSRGNRKLPIFEDDYDRRCFDNVVSEAVRRDKIRICAGCQMGNHYHFVRDAPRGNLSDAMQYINGVFSQESNRRHRRTGHLFEARFHSLIVQRERYFRRSCRYVVRNPLQAGIVRDVAHWPWSTFLGLDRSNVSRALRRFRTDFRSYWRPQQYARPDPACVRTA